MKDGKDPPSELKLSSNDRIVLVSALAEQGIQFLKLAHRDEDKQEFWLFRRSENIKLLLKLQGN